MNAKAKSDATRIRNLRSALRAILRVRPSIGLDPKAKVGDRYVVDWNVHGIARKALREDGV